MKALPQSDKSLVLRTNFSSDKDWMDLCFEIAAKEEDFGFQANVEFVDDRQYEDLTIEQLLKLVPEGSNHTFIFLVDNQTLAHPDRPVLVVDLFDQPGRSFRVIPSEMWGVENNLSIANMDWDDFAENTDEDGVIPRLPRRIGVTH